MGRRLGLCALLLAVAAQLATAGVARPLTDVRRADFQRPRLVDDGSAVYAVSSADLTGGNPLRRPQVFRWETATGAVEQITASASGVFDVLGDLTAAAVSDDGERLAFVSTADPTGANPDRGREVFAMNRDGSGLIQLTSGVGDGFILRVEISGDGGRVTFDSTFDYLGTNPTGDYRIWVVDDDGSNLRQLNTSFGIFPTISDDGTRIAWAGNGIEGALADGSGLHQIAAFGDTFPIISGDGGTVVMLGAGTLPNQSPGWCNGGQQIAAVDWDGSNPTKLSGLCAGAAIPASVALFDVSDDGSLIAYSARNAIGSALFRVGRDGTGETFLTPGNQWDGVGCPRLGLSGDGSTIAAICEDGVFDPGNPDGGRELLTLDSSGANVDLLTTSPRGGDSEAPTISGDGKHVFFVSSAALVPAAPDGETGLYHLALDGSAPELLDSFESWREPGELDATADGGTVVYSVKDPTDARFGVYAVEVATGTATTLAADPSTDYRGPSIDGAGTWVVLHDDTTDTIHRVVPDGSGFAPVVAGDQPTIDDAGRVVFRRPFDGILKIDVDGTNETTLFGMTASLGGHARNAGVVVFRSSEDPLGTNPDGGEELFEVDLVTSSLRQLTFTTGLRNSTPAISADGTTVFFKTGTPSTPEIARLDTTTLAVTPAGGLAPCTTSSGNFPFSVADDGTKAVFSASSPCADTNHDGNTEVLLVDLDAPALLHAVTAQPTLWRWDVDPAVSRYDVIRASSLTPTGGTVDLGQVVCLENDSTDASTADDEDATLPPPGSVWFYLLRGDTGGGYGTSSAGTSRVASGGDCPS